jgi:hypothetical protein
VLTEYQGACRGAHQQVQLLQDLYEHLAGKGNLPAVASMDAGERIRELRAYEEALARKLEEQELLPMRPDPEKEGLLELITDLKAAFGSDDRPAAYERLAAEESDLLHLTEQMLQHDDDASIREGRARTREAIARLSGSPVEADADR